MQVALSIIKSISLGVWLGALIMLGYGVAGPIFRESPSKTLAGTMNGIILSRMNNIEWVCGGLALACAMVLLWFQWDSGKGLRIAETVSIAVALIVLWIYSVQITSRMESLRAEIKDFDHPLQTTAYIQAKSEFDSLHHRYTSLVGFNMFLILTSFVLSNVNLRKS